MISPALVIEKCSNCGHDIMASGDLVKHTNTKDGHRFFTKFCQECECATPSIQKKELAVSFPKRRGKTREKIAKLVDEGKTNREISKTLQLALSTVSYHVGAITAVKAAVAGSETHKAESKTTGENETAKDPTGEAASLQNKNPPKTGSDSGVLKSRVEVACFEGYYDTQKKLISETVKEEIYHAGKGKTITMEVRQLPDRTRVVVEIIGEDVQ